MSIETQNDILKYLDEVSRKYSNYNKLVFLNKKLDLNYIEFKKTILNSDTSKLQKEKESIKLAIRNALLPLIYNDDEDVIGSELDNNIDACLSEQINKLEEEIIEIVSLIQSILVEYLISSEYKYSNIMYVIKLKELKNLLIVENELLDENIFNAITSKLMNSFEFTASNLTEKIKYSIITEILSTDKYIRIYKNIKFNKLTDLDMSDDEAIIVLSVDGSFLQLAKVDSLNTPMKSLKNNTKFINIENMSYLLNNPDVTKDTKNYEELFTLVHNKFPEYSNVRIENMFLANVSNNSFIIIMHDDTFSILNVQKDNDSYSLSPTSLSESYNVFSFSNLSNLPALYKKNETIIQKALNIFTFFS